MEVIYWVQILSSKRYGGTDYSEKVKKIVSSRFNLEVIDIKAKYLKNRYLKFFEWYLRALFLKKRKGLMIIDNSCSILPFNFSSKIDGKSLALVYHIDSSQSSFRKPLGILEKSFLKNLRKVNGIVVISEYWKKWFQEKDFNNVFKIYCTNEVEDISEEEVEEFKREHNLTKPIVYIGNCQKVKGVVETYEALKDLDVHLITSGKEQVKVNTLNLDLSKRDYLKLLKASSVVVTMSKFKEGWCMTAAEAMLYKVPVIGSGKGGMKELIETQIITDFKDLREKVGYLLSHPEKRRELGEKGYSFASKFTYDRFKDSWLQLIEKWL